MDARFDKIEARFDSLPCGNHGADLAVVNTRLGGHDAKIKVQCEEISRIKEQHAEERGSRRRTTALAASAGSIW